MTANITDAATGTATLAAFAAGVDAATLPGEVVSQAKRLLLDTIGCMVGGHATEAGRLALRWAVGAGGGSAGAAGATVLATRHRLPPLLAAYANGRLAAVLDADETWPSARQTAHLAAASVAAALATTEARDASGADLVASIAAGYEVGARISDALVPPRDAGTALRAGWGPGSPLGATAAAARGLELDAARAVHALGIAGTHADAPPLQWPHERPAPMAKSADAGWHALSGVAAAGMAEAGLTGYSRLLDGEEGLWRALGYAGWDAEALLGGLGERWRILDAAFKRWPCQYWMHPPLTALVRVLERHRPEPDRIEQIVLATNRKSAGPKFRDADPPGEIDRAFSLPHAAAMLVLGVPPGPRWLDDAIATDDSVRRLRELVEVEVHADADRIGEWVVDHGYRDLPARATVRVGGRDLTAEIRHGMGAPWSDETRLSDDDLAAKGRELAEPVLTDARRRARFDDAIDWIRQAESRPGVRTLTRLLEPTEEVT